MSSDSEEDFGGPPPARCDTGEFGAFHTAKSGQEMRTSRKEEGASSPSLQSPVSPASSFRWDRGQSFRLYAVSSKSQLLRRGTTFAVTSDVKLLPSSNMPASQTARTAISKLKDFIMMHGATTEGSTLPMNIKRGPRIGAGGYADVYCGINNISGELVAIKEIHVGENSQKQRQDINAIELEFGLLRKLHHPNVIQYLLFDYSISQSVCRIVMEFMSGGSAQEILMKYKKLEEHLLRKWARQLFSGLAFIHAEGITHRDIKPANLLIHSNGTLKMADFGCSKRLTELNIATMHLMGTPVYMAPEFIKGTMHRKSDVWAAGCTLLELGTGQQPWSHTKLREPLSLMFHISASLDIPQPPPELSNEFRDFLLCCFDRDLSTRPEAGEMLEHPWLVETDEEDLEGLRLLEALGAEQCWELSQYLIKMGEKALEPVLASPASSQGDVLEPPVETTGNRLPLPEMQLDRSRISPPVTAVTEQLPPSAAAVAATAAAAQPELVVAPPPPELVVDQFFEVHSDDFPANPAFATSGNDLGESGVSGTSSGANSPKGLPTGPVHMEVPIEAMGKQMKLELDVQPSDLQLRVVDRRPSFVINMTDNIRHQIHAAMMREAADLPSQVPSPKRMLSRNPSVQGSFGVF